MNILLKYNNKESIKKKNNFKKPQVCHSGLCIYKNQEWRFLAY
jgi:hypothetical protein